jgi:hypothetical protein
MKSGSKFRKVNHEYFLVDSASYAGAAYSRWRCMEIFQLRTGSAFAAGDSSRGLVIELLCSAGLVVPALNKRLAILISVAAAGIAAEMLLFCAVQIASGSLVYGEMVYWLVVATVCAFIAYGRLVLKPL